MSQFDEQIHEYDPTQAAIEAIGATFDQFDYIVLEPGEKMPHIKGWTTNPRQSVEEITEAILDRNANVGVRMGRLGVHDVDVDCADAARIAHLFLPATKMFGRNNSERRHYIYRDEAITGSTELARSAKTRDEASAVIVEHRAHGGQTMFPPSTH